MNSQDYIFENGDLIVVKSSGEHGTISRTRFLGNTIKDNVVVKLDNGKKLIVPTNDIQLKQ